MKQIKKVVLKEATRLSQEEMKHVFGGSSVGASSCSTTCGYQPNVQIYNCMGTCIAFEGQRVVCSGPTKVLIKNCDGTSSVFTK